MPEKLSKTYCIGDIHGSYRGLIQALERCNFDKQNDTLICIGDVADGWPEVSECIEELLTIKHLIPILGNHDFWLKSYLEFGHQPVIWLIQGGQASLENYVKNAELKNKHLEMYFSKCALYYIDENYNAYVHGGYASKGGLGNDSQDTYTWDRSLWEKAKSAAPGMKCLEMTAMYKKVFIGHTSIGNTTPQKKCNVWNLDTGGGWEGKITIMNVDDEAFWQSDKCSDLYPGIAGRGYKY